jgi:hypothetical protein
MVTETPNPLSALLPDRHPQHDLFICDVADAVLKDVMAQMEHPFYSLSKKPDTVIRRYRPTPTSSEQAHGYDLEYPGCSSCRPRPFDQLPTVNTDQCPPIYAGYFEKRKYWARQPEGLRGNRP